MQELLTSWSISRLCSWNSEEAHAAFSFVRTVGELQAEPWKRSKDNVKVLQAVQGEAEECCWCLTFLPPSLLSPSLSFLHTQTCTCARAQTYTHTQDGPDPHRRWENVAFGKCCPEWRFQFWPMWLSCLVFPGHRWGWGLATKNNCCVRLQLPIHTVHAIGGLGMLNLIPLWSHFPFMNV